MSCIFIIILSCLLSTTTDCRHCCCCYCSSTQYRRHQQQQQAWACVSLISLFLLGPLTHLLTYFVLCSPLAAVQGYCDPADARSSVLCANDTCKPRPVLLKLTVRCLCHPTALAKALCFRAVRPPRSFVRSDIITTISPEQLEQFWFTIPADDLIRFRGSKVKVRAGRRGGRGIHVDAGASMSIF